LERGKHPFLHEADTDPETCLHQLIGECVRLDNDSNIATTLIIYSHGFSDFYAYLDFLALAEALLAAQGYEGIYQLASFHPDYCFAQAAADDAANYTNRSPYPCCICCGKAISNRRSAAILTRTAYRTQYPAYPPTWPKPDAGLTGGLLSPETLVIGFASDPKAFYDVSDLRFNPCRACRLPLPYLLQHGNVGGTDSQRAQS